jgi:hypothetical protein
MKPAIPKGAKIALFVMAPTAVALAILLDIFARHVLLR